LGATKKKQQRKKLRDLGKRRKLGGNKDTIKGEGTCGNVRGRGAAKENRGNQGFL